MNGFASRDGGMPPTSFINGPKASCPFPTVPSAILHHVSLYPEYTAAIDLSGDVPRQMTYRQLQQRSQMLARNLQAHGVCPGDRVPLVVKRGIEMLVGISAILLCGAQYVPLDGGVVAEKTLETVVAQSGKTFAVCIASTRYRFESSGSHALRECTVVVIEAESDDDNAEMTEEFPSLATSEGGCYVIYTSGMYS